MPDETARPYERIAMPQSDEPGAAPGAVALGIESPDVIVVGGRAAGAASALLLARGGVPTLLIDDGSTGSYSPSTHALMRGGVLQLSRWGLLDSIVAAGTPPVKRTTVRYRDDTTIMSVKPSHGVEALYAPHPDVLGPVLKHAAIDAGAMVRDDISVTGLVADHGRIVGVRGTTKHGAAITVGGKLVIGADGLESIVARHVDATPSRVGHHAAAMTYGYWSGLDVRGFEFVYRPRACSGFVPTSGGRVCVFASGPPERIGQGGVDVITEIVREGAPELAHELRDAKPPDVTPLWSGRPGFIRHAHGAGWALVGDAGCYQDPVSAHALTDALRDAELLARAVIDGSRDDTSMDAALEQYESTRDWLSIHRFDVIDRIASHEWDSTEMAALQLQLSSAMSNEIEVLAALDS